MGPTNKILKGKHIDSVGRVIFNADTLFDLIMSGKNIKNFLTENTEETNKFNVFSKNYKLRIYSDEEINESAEEYDKKHTFWYTPEEYNNINIFEWLMEHCQNDTERMRVQEEFALYKERNLLPLLKYLLFLVDHFRKNNIVWGVGRGSSVSSFILYLIGVHKVNSLKYNLSITEFLR